MTHDLVFVHEGCRGAMRDHHAGIEPGRASRHQKRRERKGVVLADDVVVDGRTAADDIARTTLGILLGETDVGTAQSWVEHALDTAFTDAGILTQGNRKVIRSFARVFAVKITSGNKTPIVEHEGVIRCRVELTKTDFANEIQRLKDHAVNLRGATHGVSILNVVHGLLVDLGGVGLGVHHVADTACGFTLATVTADLMNLEQLIN